MIWVGNRKPSSRQITVLTVCALFVPEPGSDISIQPTVPLPCATSQCSPAYSAWYFPISALPVQDTGIVLIIFQYIGFYYIEVCLSKMLLDNSRFDNSRCKLPWKYQNFKSQDQMCCNKLFTRFIQRESKQYFDLSSDVQGVPWELHGSLNASKF